MLKENKMNIIYKITYLPHLNTNYPKFYIGSKMNYSSSRFYLGSVSSKQIFEYTENMPLYQWWKLKTKNCSSDFLFEILEIYNCDANELLLYEEQWQRKLDISSNEYFNQAYATKNFCSKKNSESQKLLKSKKTKEFWASPEGELKKERLRARNKINSSDNIKRNLKYGKLHNYTYKNGYFDYGESIQYKIGFSYILIDGIKYKTLQEASKKLNTTAYIVKRKCLSLNFKSWEFIYE